ncbi:hypothetical protein TKK_0011921 [Trichogramma kaykai]|uniref:V-type proton ATPase subunit C n=2 Tax=Apocrita TaxID=7400 RepID=A0ABD2WP88_9HYME
MTEYWLISAPGDKTCQQTWETMNNLTSKQNSLSNNYKFHIPDLKVGTLDQLVGLSDDLGKLDTYVEQITRKVAVYLGEVLEDQRDKLQENLMANNCQTSLDGEAGSPDRSPETPPNTPVTPCFKSMAGCSGGNKDGDHHTHPHHWKDHLQDLPDSLETANLIGQQHEPQQSFKHSSENHEYHQSDDSNQSCQAPHAHRQPNHQHHHHHSHLHHHQHHHQHHHHHHHHHHQHQHHHHQDGASSHAGISICAAETRGSHDSSSCYQSSHWCVSSSATSTPSPRQSPSSCSPPYSCSPAGSSQSCSSGDEQQQNCLKKSTNRRRKNSQQLRLRRRRQQQQQQQRLQPLSSCASSLATVSSDDDNDQQQRQPTASSTADANMQEQAASSLPNPGDLPTYITRFQWDMAKYPIKQSLRNIADIISKQVGQIDADLKTKSTTYNNLKGSLQNLEKKQTGSLLTRNLADLVKKEHFILDSEYLTTLLVIVPRASFQEWNTLYEKLTDMIVPRSSVLITQDQEYGLYTVTLFKKVIEEFKLHAREKKFIVRDFTYNEEELAAGKNEMTKLVTDKKKQFGPLVRWLKVNFSECFCAWIHVKALRVFVESVLRYGLPVNFQAILLHPNKKSTKRLRDVLNQLYAHLDSSATAGSASGNQDSVDIPGLGFGQSDYFPYVYYKINVDMVDNKV